MPQQVLSSGNCTVCHGGQQHTIQEKLYAGIAIPEMEPMPDIMYGAGVACDGCHTDVEFIQVGDVTFTGKVSGAMACTECHGDEWYGEMLIEWQDEIRVRIDDLRPDLERLESMCQSAGGSDEQIVKALDLAGSARTKVSHVVLDGSYGAHNYAYVSAILDEVETEIEECRSILVAQRNSER
jgi:hypothetical protein